MSKEAQNKSIARPPVIVIMGHIDHGKSTLLDFIRKSNIAGGEAGGITQHIGAYEVDHNDRKVTFLDTPGHEAFSCVRDRGAQVADIAILIVSAEDGVKPQTKEAVKCIEAQKLPMIVAINKIDSPKADLMSTKQGLAEAGIYVEGFGGHIPIAEISALTGDGVSDLLETILLMADVEEFTGTTEAAASGSVIESHLDKSKGISATIVIKNGTLKKGQFIACGHSLAPVRIIEDFLGKPHDEMTFSSPAVIIGWNDSPSVGENFEVFDTKKEAEEYIELHKQTTDKPHGRVLMEIDDGDERLVIPIVIKADTDGSVEALKKEIGKLETEKVIPKIIYTGTGNISENDVKVASGTEGSIVFGFGVIIDKPAVIMGDRLDIPLKTFDIIYDIINEVKEIIVDRTPKELVRKEIGKVKILRIFNATKRTQVVGGRVEDGSVSLGADCMILRRGEEIGSAKIKELQQNRENVKEVNQGAEFGCSISRTVDVVNGDELILFKEVEQ